MRLHCIHKSSSRRSSRSFLLLEVLLSLFFISFCIAPLLAPHFLLYRTLQESKERFFLWEHASLWWSYEVEKIAKKEFDWNQVEVLAQRRKKRATAVTPLSDFILQSDKGVEQHFKRTLRYTALCKGKDPAKALLMAELTYQAPAGWSESFSWELCVELKGFDDGEPADEDS